MEKYLFVSIILIVASFLYLKIAKKYNIVDKPNVRSSHTQITIRGGGIIFPISILLFFFLNDYQYPYFVLGVFLISIISFLDDIYTLTSLIRFPFQILAVFLILYQIEFPFSSIYLFYLVFGVGIINMFNFMDGINGITGFFSLAVLAGFYAINSNENFVNNELIIIPAISLIVFGFYNFRKKALFFAGDIGSIAIGVLIFFLGIIFTIKLSSPLILLLVIVYGADAGCTLLYRKFFTNESILDPHRHHIYQKLIDVYKLPHLKVSIIYGFIQLLVNVIIYKSYKLEFLNQLYLFLGLVSIFIIVYVILFKRLKKI